MWEIIHTTCTYITITKSGHYCHTNSNVSTISLVWSWIDKYTNYYYCTMMSNYCTVWWWHVPYITYMYISNCICMCFWNLKSLFLNYSNQKGLNTLIPKIPAMYSLVIKRTNLLHYWFATIIQKLISISEIEEVEYHVYWNWRIGKLVYCVTIRSESNSLKREKSTRIKTWRFKYD